MRMFLVALVVLGMFGAAALAGRGDRDPMEGQWDVVYTPVEAGGTNLRKDVFTFTRAGQFESETLKGKGFAAVEYDMAVTRMGPATWTAETKSAQHGTAKFQGNVNVHQMSGTLTWTQADGAVATYQFNGQKREK